MRLTTKGRFAVTAMLDLALHQRVGPVALSIISQRQNISLPYLEQLFGKLRRAGIVESVRGPGGGYTFAQPPESVTVAHIVIAVDEHLDATRCGGRGGCDGAPPEGGHCMTHELWVTLNRTILVYLESVTLQDLINQQRSESALIQYRPTTLNNRLTTLRSAPCTT